MATLCIVSVPAITDAPHETPKPVHKAKRNDIPRYQFARSVRVNNACTCDPKDDVHLTQTDSGYCGRTKDDLNCISVDMDAHRREIIDATTLAGDFQVDAAESESVQESILYAVNTAGELRDASRRAAEHPDQVIGIGADQSALGGAKPNPTRPGTMEVDKAKSFDMTVEQGGAVVASVEVTRVPAPVSNGGQMMGAVSHAVGKVEDRLAAGSPIPGRHEETIMVTLARSTDRGSAGTLIVRDDGYRMVITREEPPKERELPNLWDEFAGSIVNTPGHEHLDEIVVVDAESGARLSGFIRDGHVWRRL